ncbi:nuclear transport factor 2 family protein [Azospirillum sp. A1-3]|uniref:nuclear transport factor 2 family protein n=1 Tax=Azospirillum sp. A1-3 TaxID=185874 RepID=UPI002077362F|nr:nuclear transport factor 2 family protein [Azospirillum sp. A1-3]MCM8735744.1 nuclear transport factor 2 family protein [Azospirillum sp. A1-3]
MTTSATATFDFGDLKKALEHSDAATLIGLYADDAEMVIVDRNRPPSSPMTFSGREAIAAFWRDVCSRDMTHYVGHEVVGPNRAAFVEECAYPDGCHVMSAMTLDLRGGRIAKHLTVQAWDEVSCATGRAT